MVAIRIRTNASDWIRLMRDGRRQMPFAIALALTRVAQDARRAARREAADSFKIRAKGRLLGSENRNTGTVRYVPASKRDKPIRSQVAIIDAFMALHATGGVKRPKRGAKQLAIPTRYVARARTSGGKIPSRFKPRKLFDAKRAFVTPTEIRKTGEKRSRGALRRIGLLFLRRRRARIRQTWGFEKAALEAARRKGPRHFHEAVHKALEPRVPIRRHS